MNIFFGYEDFVEIYFESSKIVYIYGSFLCILGSFLKVKVQNGGCFFGCKNFKYSLGCLKFLIFIWDER